MDQNNQFIRIGQFLPVTITTFPLTLGPVESGATFFRIGMFSKVPWSLIGATNCSLSAASLLFAAEVIVNQSTALLDEIKECKSVRE
jgi:hypothetical protein